MAGAGDEATSAGEPEAGEMFLSPDDKATRGVTILERLAAGVSLMEVAAREGLTPRRARELVAEAVAQRGFDP
jgi:hypothetical protein